MTSEKFDFQHLVRQIKDIHDNLLKQATKAVNVGLTLRNWLIGMHIAEYELKGIDRAVYGDRLITDLSKQLTALEITSCDRRQLYRYLAFYRTYPQIAGSLPPQFKPFVTKNLDEPSIVGSAPPQFQLSPGQLTDKLSYTHLEALVEIEDPLKRYFYETECIRGGWSVRELKRQIASLYYERSGLSNDKKKLSELTLEKSEKQSPIQIIRDPYIFEFLGIKPKEVMSESDLEDALLDKIQEFLLELGHGFCFEARQKRILIGDEFFFVDLVFYHRKLKCHVLIELKVDDFKHEYLGQLNTYVNWFAKNEQTDGDYPPVGILLCTQKNHALVEYALAGMDNQLFVSRYQLELPRKEQIQTFIEEQIAEQEKE
ncbi:MAG: PDDEXK nuclease domain-containing protein [Planctomycetota bacterium]|jgi:predicted nuclease of restriction endonuclease-like (RecB) superfamily